MYYVYFLLLKNSKVYTGITENPRRRMQEHKTGKVKSTRNLRPFKFIGYEAYLLKNDVERRERFLKTTEGRRLFRQQHRKVLLVGSPSHSTGRPVG